MLQARVVDWAAQVLAIAVVLRQPWVTSPSAPVIVSSAAHAVLPCAAKR